MKTISEKQLEANRKNAQLGGVKTEQGKAVSKFNAIKHGILSKNLVLEGEDNDSFERLRSGIVEEFEPHTELERLLADRIVSCAWRLRRSIQAERELMAKDCRYKDSDSGKEELQLHRAYRHEYFSPDDKDSYQLVNRYEIMLERSLYKAIHELQRAQASRKGEGGPPPAVLDVDVSK